MHTINSEIRGGCRARRCSRDKPNGSGRERVRIGGAQEVDKVIVGQRQMVERVLLGMLTGGHVLLEGVPGLAKTLTVNTLAATMAAQFQQIQFTPDLLPADLIET